MKTNLLPTHFVCNVCRKERNYLPKKNREIWLCDCGMKYELVQSKYGVHQVVIGGKEEQ